MALAQDREWRTGHPIPAQCAPRPIQTQEVPPILANQYGGTELDDGQGPDRRAGLSRHALGEPAWATRQSIEAALPPGGRGLVFVRLFDARTPGQTPYTLYDYLPKNALVVLDESHVAVPQIGGMYRGDRARKETLVEYGWRMPSALDNRPLRFDEWEERAGQRIYVSATPAEYELQRCGGVVVEQIIRPTGLVDPKIEIRPANGQVDDLLAEIQTHVQKEERVLVTTLTKRMAEELTDYYAELGVRIRYLHSDIKTIERMEIIRELREGKTTDGKSKLKQPSGSLSTAEAISVITSGIALATHFGDGKLKAADIASGMIGAIVKDPVQDKVVMQEYLETVIKERDGWKDLYRACKEVL